MATKEKNKLGGLLQEQTYLFIMPSRTQSFARESSASPYRIKTSNFVYIQKQQYYGKVHLILFTQHYYFKASQRGLVLQALQNILLMQVSHKFYRIKNCCPSIHMEKRTCP